MIRLFRGPTSTSASIALLVLSACNHVEELSSQAHLARPSETKRVDTAEYASAATSPSFENPFTATFLQGPGEGCLSITVESRPGHLPEALVTNQCGDTMAVLTSPLEVRVRRIGTEKLVNERMSWAAYAILYVASAELGKEAFRGDGIIRDGGLRVRQPPGYTTIGPRASIAIPLQCEIDVPSGRYHLLLSTFETPLLDAPSRSDPFDCTQSVEHWNEGKNDAAHLSLSGAASQISSISSIVKLTGTDLDPRR